MTSLPTSKSTPESTTIVMIFVTRKPGTTLAEMKDYYETKHIPLAVKLFMHGDDVAPIRWTRQYIDRGDDGGSSAAGDWTTTSAAPATASSFPFGGAKDFDYDCLTQLVFRDTQHRDRCLEVSRRFADEIAADEANFLDREKLRIIFVQEGWVGGTHNS